MTPRARLTAFVTAGAAVGMLALAFAAEPLYSTFCKVTGFGGTTQVAEKASATVLDRPIRVRFDANVSRNVPLDFRPVQEFIDANVGETIIGYFEVSNTSSTPLKGMASYNVVPFKMGKYFNKVECFCFKEKLFQPGVVERLPVVFYVSPDMAQDAQANDVSTITLSYTYFISGELKPTARLEDASAVY